MNSLHDLGGMHGFGRLWSEPEGTTIHTDAERRILRMMLGLMMTGWIDTDGYRSNVESLPLELYSQECFPQTYLAGLEKQLEERGFLLPGDLDALMEGHTPPERTGRKSVIPQRNEQPAAALYAPGDIVRIRNRNPDGHTRLPRYLRGQTGAVIATRGTFDFPDALAARTGRRPQPVYTVRFSARDLWGERAGTRDTVSAEMWQEYIEGKVERDE